MKTSKLFLFAVAFVLLAGLGAGVIAQSKIKVIEQINKVPPVSSVTRLNAIEISDGTIGYDTNRTDQETVFGYSFLGRTTGAYPGSFSLSMNCIPATPTPGGYSEMTGGSWALPVYTTNLLGGVTYAGSLYGTIAKGGMNWGKIESADVFFVLNVDGGTQQWAGFSGTATFYGTLLHDEKTDTTTLSGDLVFKISPGIFK